MNLTKIISYIEKKSPGSIVTIDEVAKNTEIDGKTVEYWFRKLSMINVVKSKKNHTYFINRCTVLNSEIMMISEHKVNKLEI